jgi:hypothetical protein
VAGHSALPEPKEPLTTSLVEALHFRYFHKDFCNHTDKKENKIFSCIRKLRGNGFKVIYMTTGLLIYGEKFCAFPHILQEALPLI